MDGRKKLSKKQLAVIDDLFAGELDEQTILAKHKIKKITYNQWLADVDFQAELSRRIDTAKLMSKVLIARYSLAAAAKLVQLTESEKEETARRACLDIIEMPRQSDAKDRSEQINEDKEKLPELSDETASRLLAALAEEKNTD
jgi:hypothetical protein